MRYTCEKCATRHETPEQIFECARDQRKVDRFVIGLLVSVALAILVIEIAWNQYAYGDWKCVFMQCRKVVP